MTSKIFHGSSQFTRGSEWRKWDLHIHSDASDGKATCVEIVAEAVKKNLAVIALTDHHTVSNLDIIKGLAAKNDVCVISGIEFRTEYGDKSVHMIGLFPDEHNGTILDSRNLNENILIKLGLSAAHIREAGRKALAEKGKPSPSDNEAYKAGLFSVQVDFRSAADLIHSFGGIVTVHAGSKENGIETEMKHDGKPGVRIIDSLGPVKEDLFEKGYIDICEINKDIERAEFYLRKFEKPSIIASDAHAVNGIGSRFTWIKANPSFSGLLTIINEPQSRVIIEGEPEIFGRVKQNGTKYIDKLTVEAIPTYDERNGKWFEHTEVVFGRELTVIIGNKGSGKSAITDIIGLCGHSKHSGYFSFLRKGRFLEKGYAENFSAELNWVAQDKSTKIALNEPVDLSYPEEIQYLPQGYFEIICNEVENSVELRKEINSVVFQHIPEEIRHGKASFEEYLQYKKSAIDRAVSAKKHSLSENNAEIVRLEKLHNPKTREEIEKSLFAKKAELSALREPQKVDRPTGNKGSDKAISALNIEAQTIEEEIDSLEKEIKKVSKHYSRTNDQIELLSQMEREILDKQDEMDGFIRNSKRKLKGIKGLNFNEIFSLSVDLTPLQRAIRQARADAKKDGVILSEVSVENDTGEELSKVAKKQNLEIRLGTVRKKLDEPSNKYQLYRAAMKSWLEKREKIEGSKTTPNTVKYLEAQLRYIDNEVENEIKKKRSERSVLVTELYSAKREVIEIYCQVKTHIDRVIDLHKERFINYPINIIAETIVAPSIIQDTLKYISKTVAGTYRGSEDAEKKFAAIKEMLDPNQVASVNTFLNRIITSLEQDERQGTLEKRYIDDQIQDPLKFYNFLFSLDYLTETYELKLGEKSIEKLSPGEKGALLIVFYLLLDKRDTPLVLDQPEDNLDNESVSEILVPFINEARKRRQIIMVTHNPNLAVYADAEQVIRVEINKKEDCSFTLFSGGIEDEVVRKHIIDVLEGTMPAFDNRRKKYKGM